MKLGTGMVNVISDWCLDRTKNLKETNRYRKTILNCINIKCEDTPTHIKSLKGNFGEYMDNASDHVIDQIQIVVLAFIDGCCLCKRRGI